LFSERIAWRTWLLVATCFHIANALLLNIPFHLHVLVYLPFVAFSRLLGRSKLADSAKGAAYSWRVPLIVSAIILGAAHTAQRLKGGGSQFLFIEGGSVVRLTLYVSLVLLTLCGAMIAIDLGTRLYDRKFRSASGRHRVSDDAKSGLGSANR
jgi:hypothetical protein